MLYLFKKEERDHEKGERTREWIDDKRKLLTFFNEAEHSIHMANLAKYNKYEYNREKAKSHLLLNFVDFNMTDTGGQNALFDSNPEMTEYLLNKGVNINQIDIFNETALFGALSFEKSKILIDGGIDKSHQNHLNETALFNCGDIKKLKLLVESGFDVNHKNKNNETVLFLADTLEKVDYLISKGIDLNVKSNRGYNALLSMSIDVSERMIESGISIEDYPSDLEELKKMFYFNPEKADFMFKKKRDSILKDVEEIQEHINKESKNNPSVIKL